MLVGMPRSGEDCTLFLKRECLTKGCVSGTIPALGPCPPCHGCDCGCALEACGPHAATPASGQSTRRRRCGGATATARQRPTRPTRTPTGTRRPRPRYDRRRCLQGRPLCPRASRTAEAPGGPPGACTASGGWWPRRRAGTLAARAPRPRGATVGWRRAPCWRGRTRWCGGMRSWPCEVERSGHALAQKEREKDGEAVRMQVKHLPEPQQWV